MSGLYPEEMIISSYFLRDHSITYSLTRGGFYTKLSGGFGIFRLHSNSFSNQSVVVDLRIPKGKTMDPLKNNKGYC